MIGMHAILPSRHAKLSSNRQRMDYRSKLQPGAHILHSFCIKLSRLQSTSQLVAWLPLVKRHASQNELSHRGIINMASYVSYEFQSRQCVAELCISVIGLETMKQSGEFWNLQIDTVKNGFLKFHETVRNANLVTSIPTFPYYMHAHIT